MTRSLVNIYPRHAKSALYYVRNRQTVDDHDGLGE